MRRVTLAAADSNLRARRWDAIVLGGALPGLAAAARLGAAGLRVLVVEEALAARRAYPLREPFFLPACESGSVVDACLKALGVPLIDRRRLLADPVAYQIVFPEARIDVGEPGLTAEELVAWGLADHDGARSLVAALSEAALAERDAMLDAPVVRVGSLRALARSVGATHLPRHARGLPELAARPVGTLQAFLEAQIRALSALADAAPPPEARARLLGVALAGGASPETPESCLRPLLVRRIRELHGDFRTLRGGFEFVAIGNDPGIAIPETRELFLGRVLVLNAPLSALAAVHRESSASEPSFLETPAAARRRISVQLRVETRWLPEGMARRVIWVRDPRLPLEATNLLTLAVFPSGSATVDLVVHAVAPADAEREPIAAEIEAALAELLPFSAGRLTRDAGDPPVWDDDELLADPRPGRGWPGEAEIRVSARPPVFALSREATGALGVEGDLLLGWRSGDAIASTLA